jgi:uncharacterized integral membrane protein
LRDVADEEKSPSRVSPRLVAGGVAVLIAAVFVLQNRDKARIRFLVLDFHVGVWFGLLVTFVLGAVVGLVAGRARGGSD